MCVEPGRPDDGADVEHPQDDLVDDAVAKAEAEPDEDGADDEAKLNEADAALVETGAALVDTGAGATEDEATSDWKAGEVAAAWAADALLRDWRALRSFWAARIAGGMSSTQRTMRTMICRGTGCVSRRILV